MNGDAAYKRNKVQRIYESLFSLNVGFAVAYALFAYDGSSRIAVYAPESVRDMLQAFGQALIRIAPIGVHQRTRSELLRSAMIREAVFVALVLGVALLLYMLVRLFARTAARRRALIAISGIAALTAVPGCWLYIVRATWFDYAARTFWATYGYVSLLEIAIAGGLLYFVKNQPIWRGTLVFALHYLFWASGPAYRVLCEGRGCSAVTAKMRESGLI